MLEPDSLLLEALVDEDRTAQEKAQLVRLTRLFAELEPPPDPYDLFPDYAGHKDRLLKALDTLDGEQVEEALLNLYCHVHGHAAPYTQDERRLVDATGGYWCHAGGISPLLKAEPFIHSQTVSGDFGAGNGLQGLLLQKLYPHRKTIQIEISSRMVDAGRQLQDWLEIPRERVEWVVGDVCDASPTNMSFIYLYRPVRPEGRGRRFYQDLARSLEARNDPVVIFSIADCLREFLSPRFEVFYTGGHLTCFRSR